MKNHQKGFTLIEILVVIAIIGILASVVLAALNSARSKARDAQRKETLKQISRAAELYYNDNLAYPVTTGWLSGWNPTSNPLAPAYIPIISAAPAPGLYQYWRKDFRNPAYPCLTTGTKEQYGFYALLENPTPEDTATMSDAFDVCVRSTWGMNYKVGN